MGAPPPPDAPSIPAQTSAAQSASFQPSVPGPVSICGFQIPGFSFNLSFSLPIPPINFPPPFPFALPLNCDLATALETEVTDGGGRVGTPGLDADPEFG